MIRRVYFIIFSLILTGCTESESQDPIEQLLNSMRWLKSANPVYDATKAYKENDFRFLGITGYGLSLPGLPSSMKIDEGKYKVIGYCEIIEGQEHMDLCMLAARYAESYNAKLLSLMREGKNKE